MTIKPVVPPSQKRGGAVDGEKKESHSHAAQAVVGGEQANNHSQPVRSSVAHAHRNAVIDALGKNTRGEVYDELARHRRSPNKNNSRTKRHESLHKRDRGDREKLSNVTTGLGSPLMHGVGAVGVVNSRGSSPVSLGGKSPEHLAGIPGVSGATTNTDADETFSGYNSGDEYMESIERKISAEEWERRDEKFAQVIGSRGFVLRPVEEDGACLFRAISLQIYGDEGMHDVIRQQTMDYIHKNRDYFRNFVTEDINSYIKRKRRKDSHGNHIEIQAISEIYNRPVELYSYDSSPSNIFNSDCLNNGHAPLRLSYQRNSHYNAIIDPYNATVGVGLGLAGYKPELQTEEAKRLSEQLQIEQTMFEDKLKTTDWEATNEAIEEQIARESYLQWCRDNVKKKDRATSSATVTSAEAALDAAEASPSKFSLQQRSSIGSNIPAAAVMGARSGGSSPTDLSSTSSSPNASFTTLERALAMSLNKKDSNNYDLGFDSDDTDISTTSSIGNNGAAGGGKSPSQVGGVGGRNKKKVRGNTSRGNPKRRREHNPALLGVSDIISKRAEASPRKSPRHESSISSVTNAVTTQDSRAHTPEAEQKPSTSKQSCTPPKKTTVNNGEESSPSPSKFGAPSLYEELLEATYASDGFGRDLSESELLQRAIQMSTNDYIEEQRRKYLYGP